MKYVTGILRYRGAVVGVLGSVLTALVGARNEERRVWRETLRSVVANLASEVSQLRDLSHQLRRDPDNPDLRQAAEEAHTRARGFQEQLRLTSKSVATQEAGRRLIHCVYYQWRATQGGRSDFWESRRSLDKRLTRLYAEARKEFGLGNSEVYEDPDGGLPIPARQEGLAVDGRELAGGLSPGVPGSSACERITEYSAPRYGSICRSRVSARIRRSARSTRP